MKPLTVVCVVILFIVGLFLIFPEGCTQPNEARRVLSTQGYSDIEITGYRPLMAGKDDVYSTGFKAKTANGSIVTGAVTSGAFKGHTIRLD